MPGRPKYPVFFVASLIILLLQGKPLQAQQQPFLNKKITISFNESPLSFALNAIGKRTGVKFSYNPQIIPPGRIINKQFDNVPLREVLSQMINDASITYREIGNQIVIYRGDPALLPLEPNQQLIKSKPQIVPSSKKEPDTVFVYQLDTLLIKHSDTIFHRISITHFDTIRLRDTVFVEKSVNESSLNTPRYNDTICTDTLKQRIHHTNQGFYFGLYAEHKPGNPSFNNTATSNLYFDLMQKANTGLKYDFSAGLSGGYDFHRIGFRTGVGINSMSENFAFSYIVENGGFFRKDTIEKYYTVTGIDTSWFFITDSTWIPKDRKEHNFKYANQYKYIDVPFSIKLIFLQNRFSEVYALLGANAAFLLKVDAMRMAADSKSVIMINKNELNPILFSWHCGLGTSLKLSTHSGINLEAVYHKQTNSQYKDWSIDKRYSMMGYKMVLYWKF